ncbi:uncharacterized protein LOC110717715 [Chenopodium quinoa]|uniref:uncharacterized protein LOC110717715 n=1 Tax=Chenopodium quinoa TaxID=63459 RepID=UPI000B78A9C2|nr:uncharacterized protein LOC110717715 [Chenopodium quinoa]
MDNQPSSHNQTPNNQLISLEQMEQNFQLFQKMNKTQTNPESGTSRTVGVAGKSSFSDNTNWCNHCGGTKHTKKGCFELVEYHRQKAATKVGVNQTGGKANVVVYLNPENKDSGNEDNTSVEQSNTDEITSMRSEENTTGKNGGDEARKKQRCSNRRDHWAWY